MSHSSDARMDREKEMSDIIDREALLKEVRENKELYERERVYLEGLLLNAPAVDINRMMQKAFASGVTVNTRPQGEWITEYDRLKCPFCGMSIDDEVHWLYSEDYNFNFCPNCGAKMEGGAE